MKAKKPLLLVIFVLALLVAALILPAVTPRAGEDKPGPPGGKEQRT
jgi:hypothetical protein